MQTYPIEARKAVDEAQEQAAVRLHRFVKPFERQNTVMWRERERIRNTVRRIRDGADEAWLCLEKAVRDEHDIIQASTALGEMDTAISELYARPKIVCLCGSTRFVETYNEWRKKLTLEGDIVLAIEIVTAQTRDEDPQHVAPEVKQRLDELHLRKIDMADEVMFLNVGGYIGESTRRELAYCREHGKTIVWLETAKALMA